MKIFSQTIMHNWICSSNLDYSAAWKLRKSTQNIGMKDCRRLYNVVQKMKFSIMDFFSKCDQFRRFPLTWPHFTTSATNIIMIGAIWFEPTTTQFVNEHTTIWPNAWVFVYKLSGCESESRCCHLNFRYRPCFEQGVPWHSGKL